MAFIQRNLGDFDTAIGTLESLLQSSIPPRLSPDDIQFQLAYTHQRASHDDKASQIYSELYKRHSTSIEVIQQYCWFLSLQYDRSAFEKADLIIQQSGQAGEPVLRLVAARIAMKQQDMTLAYQRYCECISFWTDSPLFWCGLGVLYFKNDQMQDAIVAFQRALYLKPELVEAWANLGLIFELQRETATALAVYQQALQACAEKDARTIKDRVTVINGGRSRQANPAQIIEINDSPFFIQVAEKVASDWVADAPAIPAKLLGVEDALDSTLAELTPPHRSLF
jgi:tetratricopeptide (TPR) repeat protein